MNHLIDYATLSLACVYGWRSIVDFGKFAGINSFFFLSSCQIGRAFPDLSETVSSEIEFKPRVLLMATSEKLTVFLKETIEFYSVEVIWWVGSLHNVKNTRQQRRKWDLA